MLAEENLVLKTGKRRVHFLHERVDLRLIERNSHLVQYCSLNLCLEASHVIDGHVVHVVVVSQQVVHEASQLTGSHHFRKPAAHTLTIEEDLPTLENLESRLTLVEETLLLARLQFGERLFVFSLFFHLLIHKYNLLEGQPFWEEPLSRHCLGCLDSVQPLSC